MLLTAGADFSGVHMHPIQLHWILTPGQSLLLLGVRAPFLTVSSCCGHGFVVYRIQGEHVSVDLEWTPVTVWVDDGEMA